MNIYKRMISTIKSFRNDKIKFCYTYGTVSDNMEEICGWFLLYWNKYLKIQLHPHFDDTEIFELKCFSNTSASLTDLSFKWQWPIYVYNAFVRSTLTLELLNFYFRKWFKCIRKTSPADFWYSIFLCGTL